MLPSPKLGSLILAITLSWLVTLCTTQAMAARVIVHRVQPGQNLGMIARRYHTTAAAIAKRNHLKPGALLKPKQRLHIAEVPEHTKWRRFVERGKGPSPAAVKAAKALKRRGKKLQEAKIRKKRAALRKKKRQAASKSKKRRESLRQAKKRVRKKSRRKAAGRTKRNKSASRYARKSHRLGYVDLQRQSERFRGKLVSARGRVDSRAAKRVARLLRSLRTGKKHKIDRRLLALLARVSDHFGGRRIGIVSGFRPYSRKQYTRNSRHNHGKAIDFRVVGVSTREVYNYCKKLARVGCGYYPTSGFVHMDVRARKTRWTDYSGPGQAPKYAHLRKRKKSQRSVKRSANRSARRVAKKARIAQRSKNHRGAKPLSGSTSSKPNIAKPTAARSAMGRPVAPKPSVAQPRVVKAEAAGKPKRGAGAPAAVQRPSAATQPRTLRPATAAARGAEPSRNRPSADAPASNARRRPGSSAHAR